MNELRKVMCGTSVIEYVLIRKSVKNINLRIKPDGTVWVSANRHVPVEYIDCFIKTKRQFIISGQRKMKERRQRIAEPRQYSKEQEEMLHAICREIHPLFKRFHIPYPEVRVRYMTSQWGSCRPQKNAITLNSRLLEAPRESIEYVVLHEFAHFVHPNHSQQFYNLVSEFLPDWKERKKQLP